MNILLSLFCIILNANTSALEKLCTANNVEHVKLKLSKYKNILNKGFDEHGCLPIHYAAYFGSSGALEELIKTKPSLVTAVDTNGYTPFQYAMVGLYYWEESEKKKPNNRYNKNIRDQKRNKKYYDYRQVIALLILHDEDGSIAAQWDQKQYYVPPVERPMSQWISSLLPSRTIHYPPQRNY